MILPDVIQDPTSIHILKSRITLLKDNCRCIIPKNGLITWLTKGSKQSTIRIRNEITVKLWFPSSYWIAESCLLISKQRQLPEWLDKRHILLYISLLFMFLLLNHYNCCHDNKGGEDWQKQQVWKNWNITSSPQWNQYIFSCQLSWCRIKYPQKRYKNLIIMAL